MQEGGQDIPHLILKIERRLRNIQDRNSSQKETNRRLDGAYQMIMADLYDLLHSGRSIRYFAGIFQSAGGHIHCPGKDLSDYMSEVWVEVYEKYDPRQGQLLSFLTSRMRAKVIDDVRKDGGLKGLGRNSGSTNHIHIIPCDPPQNKETEIMNVQASLLIDKISFNQYDADKQFNSDHLSLITGESLLALAQAINAFRHENKGGERRKKRLLYYQIFYTSDVVTCLKRLPELLPLTDERSIIKALHFDFLNYCTDRRYPYSSHDKISAFLITQKQPAKKSDIIRSGKPCDSDNGSINLPFSNEIIRSFIEGALNLQTTSSNISQMRKKYLYDMYTALHRVGVDYADIYKITL